MKNKKLLKIIKYNSNQAKDNTNKFFNIYNFLFFRVKTSLLFLFRVILWLYILSSLTYMTNIYNENIKLKEKNKNITIWTKALLNDNYTLHVNFDNASIIYKARFDSLTFKYENIKKEDVKRYDLNWNNICFWIAYFKIEKSDTVKAQILLETNFLKSEICWTNRNICGMKQAVRRSNVALSENLGHAFYTTYIESIYDYKLWQQYCYINKKEDYLKFLKRSGYATDPNYIIKLKFILSVPSYKKYFNK
jgi:hypothetical protein